MYENTELIEPFIEYAKSQVINKYEQQYKKYFIECESFMSNKLAILSNISGLQLLLNIKIDHNTFNYIYFCNEPYKLSKKLIDIFYQKFSYKYISLQTKLINNIYCILIDGYNLFTFIIDDENIQNMVTILKPLSIKSHFTDYKTKVFNYDTQLIEIYKKLSSPIFIDEWPTLYNYEKDLTQIIINNKHKFIINDNIKHGKLSIFNFFSKIRKIYENRLIEIKDISVDNKLQFISKYPIDEDFNIFSNEFINYKCKYMIQNPRIVNDKRLKRQTILIYLKFKFIPIVDIFNYGSYDLIPISLYDHFKANIFTSLRFILIDIITLQYIINISTKENKGHINELNNKYQKLLNIIDKKNQKYEDLGDQYLHKELFSNKYYGIYVNEKKSLIVDQKKNINIRNYYPATDI